MLRFGETKVTKEIFYATKNLTMANQYSHLINGKSRDLQKLLKYFNGTTNFAFNLFALSGMLHINFVLYSKDLLAVVLLLFILK